MNPKVTVVILTKNEEIHLQRCLDSVHNFADSVVIVDSGSSDRTVEIAKQNNCKILKRDWTNHSDQFNWALKAIDFEIDWVLRVDADEVVGKNFFSNFVTNLASTSHKAFTLNRYMAFCGKRLKYGGLFPRPIVRLFRHGYGHYEKRLMDEHLIIDGSVGELQVSLLDDNLNTLSWWINKHNHYSSLEALEVIKMIISREKSIKTSFSLHTNFLRFLKNKVFYKAPIFLRSLLYFLYRYIFRLGFLDGFYGFAFHFLQGFWYRFLVDLKVMEFKRMYKSGSSSELKIKIAKSLSLDMELVKSAIDD